jgi:hypothetical protein
MQKLVIDNAGTITLIYADDLSAIMGEGKVTITRASHVEPVDEFDCFKGWAADLSPVGGPVLGPFKSRAEALAAEVEYLEREVL